jgi:hypothetical protein
MNNFISVSFLRSFHTSKKLVFSRSVICLELWTHKFKTTEKGLNLLKIHNEMAELLHTAVKND